MDDKQTCQKPSEQLTSTELLQIDGSSTANQIHTLLCAPISVILFHEQWSVQNG